MDVDNEAARRLTAADVNDLAQALDDGTLTSAEILSGPDPAGAGARADVDAPATALPAAPPADQKAAAEYSLGAEEREKQAGVFPPATEPDVVIGGSPEEQAALDEEFRR